MDNQSPPDTIKLELGDTRPRRVGLRTPRTTEPEIALAPVAVVPEVQPFRASPGGIIIAGHFDRPERVELGDPGAIKDETPVIRTWHEYSTWRRTKCPPMECRAAIWNDELDQAIHEFSGESAELAEAMMEVGPFVWINAEARNKAMSELGDAIFTGSWVLDLIDPSFLRERGPIVQGFLPPDTRAEIAQRHAPMAANEPGDLHNLAKASDAVQSAVIDWHQELSAVTLNLLTNAGALSNSFKKARWYRMAFDDQAVAERIFNAFVSLDAVAEMAGISIFSAVRFNVRKLDRRFPDGWTPGGGIRPQP